RVIRQYCYTSAHHQTTGIWYFLLEIRQYTARRLLLQRDLETHQEQPRPDLEADLYDPLGSRHPTPRPKPRPIILIDGQEAKEQYITYQDGLVNLELSEALKATVLLEQEEIEEDFKKLQKSRKKLKKELAAIRKLKEEKDRLAQAIDIKYRSPTAPPQIKEEDLIDWNERPDLTLGQEWEANRNTNIEDIEDYWEKFHAGSTPKLEPISRSSSVDPYNINGSPIQSTNKYIDQLDSSEYIDSSNGLKCDKQ
ncbi:hypothetical protein FRC00_005794, partial [Tulasnella sp. 408]